MSSAAASSSAAPVEEVTNSAISIAQTDVAVLGGEFATGPDGKPVQRQETSAVLKLKGLPYTTTEPQILEFFGDYKVKGVSFVFEPDGRPSGLAFAEFESKEEALKALSKNGEYIGERYVRLLHVPKSEMEEQVRLGTLAIPGAAAKLRSRLLRAHQQRNNNLAYLAPMQLLPTIVPSARTMVQVAPSLGNGHYNGGIAATAQLPLDARGNLWQGGYQPSPMALASQFSNLSIGGQNQGYGGRGAPMAQPQIQTVQQQMQMQHMHLPQMQQQSAGMPGMPGMQHPGAPQQHLLANPRQLQSPTSSTIKVRGLPYRASPAEILAFFQGYQYLPDSLQIGLDSLGRPSGEAWLTLINPQEAMRAVRDLNRHYLGNRYLELSIC